MSHEILANASRQQVRRALDSFGDAEVHVVLSVRDLVRQIPAEWQENVKHRRTVGYGEFLDRITDPARPGELASWFWGVQEVPDILDRWGGTLPPDRVHVVTVPKPGAPRDLLWQRFTEVLGLEGVDLALETDRANPSLGVPETVLVQRINKRVNGGVLAGEDYRQFVRELLAHRTLSRRYGLPAAGPARRRTHLGRRPLRVLDRGAARPASTTSWGRSTSSGPTRPPPRSSTRTTPTSTAVGDAATESIVTLLVEAARLQTVEHRLRRDLASALAELDRSRGLWFRVKRRLVNAADDNRVAATGLAAYRRVRGSSSRST